MREVKTAAILGGGVIGAGWAARFVMNAIDVVIFDPDPEAERKVGEVMANAKRAYGKLTLAALTNIGSVKVVKSMAEALDGADFVQEAAPERLELKQKIFAEADALLPPDVLICSSTSGLLPTEMQKDMANPGRLLVGHPFNPVYLLPLVELVAGRQTDPAKVEEASAFYASIGMKPLKIRKEIEAFVADRLMEALWREALWLVHDDVATAEDVDDAIRYGCGLRWAQMGTFQVFDIAGGEQGMRHFMAQFGPALKWPWTKLMDTPEMTDALVEKIAKQVEEEAKGKNFRELERIRDDNLVAIMQALKVKKWGAGEVLEAYDAKLFQLSHEGARTADIDLSQPLKLHATTVDPEWVDYNGHMTESRYLQVFGDATDAVLRFVGCTPEYHETGGSYYTVETHIRHLREVEAGAPIAVSTQVLGADDKRLRLFHQMTRTDDGALLATAEHMCLHVGAKDGRASPAEPEVLDKVKELAAAQGALALPEGAGKAIDLPRK